MWGRAECPGGSRNSRLWTLPHGSISARPGQIFDKWHWCVCWQGQGNADRDVPRAGTCHFPLLPALPGICHAGIRAGRPGWLRPRCSGSLGSLLRGFGGTSWKRTPKSVLGAGAGNAWSRECLGPLRAALLAVPSRAFPAGMRGSLAPGSSGKRR